jgi:hypothetical protein
MLADPNIEVQEFATRAQEIKMYWEHGQITQSEYQELVDDLLELKSVNKELLSLDVMKKLDTYAGYLKTANFFIGLL